RQHLADRSDPCLNGRPGAAATLDCEGTEAVALFDPVDLLPSVDLETLTTETDHQHAAHIRIGGIAPLRPLQELVVLTLDVDRTAGAMDKRDHAVDVRIRSEER